MRRRLSDQPPWKRDIVVYAWAAMASIPDDEHLRTTDMPQWLNALLQGDTTPNVERLHQALEHMSRELERYSDNPNALEAARLAKLALAR
jgi:7,8-dihydro-6-hydroxymethylpterin-pyrophosphokinase